MSTLLLRLAGPMQSWGTDSRFDIRRTGREPSKSGVLGLAAAALGIRRRDKEALRPLAELRFGVRVDREGSMMRDFHTARPAKGSPYVTERYYLADAVFVAGLESGDRGLLERIGQALRAPAFPLYLGRRSCPPVGRVFLEIVEKPLEEALRTTAPPGATRLVLDAEPGEGGGLIRDVPLSFDPARREYAYRRVTERYLGSDAEHNPMAELEDWICT
ncbi:type I-E CRISPR-associated protein Cas5/CasD [Pseudoflavonifractor sp. MSJ-37]|uniref:type I-E CRISPR-associated protein Cas5/CasD n=1 Tax=Pseudoflavonifractor sp. MSJ-37 TaxID=2841531 RepID=UPI001C10D5B3|nr:type I-E CRISPR-associated protein Cas5/CasD [Pseudoflavonifractor sp. MSJ-37]MBU5434216.1 type I-E CRISPR-associated protein Cas5/CasD [Pseudoflavonifractor sp. MSJ-37]